MKSGMRAVGTVAVAAALFAMPFVAGAQEKGVRFGVSAGLSVPMGKLGDVNGTGYNLTGHATLSPSSLANLSFRGDVGIDRFDAKESIGSLTQKGGVTMIGFTANAIYAFSQDDPGAVTRPYILVGGGFFNGRSKVTSILGAAEDTDSSNSTDAGIQFGGGMEFNLSSGFGAFAEAKLVNVFGDGSSRRWIPISFGVRF